MRSFSAKAPLAWIALAASLAAPSVSFVVATVVLNGCSGKAIDESDPGALYNEAEEDVKNDHYQIAIDKLRSIKNKFPYSKYAVDAQLKIADVYFLQDSWPEAAASYETFRDLHPKHEKVGYAMFRLGKSHFNDIPGNIARDLTPATKALTAYQDFLARFPAAPEAAEAKKDVDTIRNTLADKELYIGNFYYKRDFLESAAPRFRKVLDLYPETKAATEAKDRLAKIGDRADKKPASENAATH